MILDLVPCSRFGSGSCSWLVLTLVLVPESQAAKVWRNPVPRSKTSRRKG